MGELPPGPSSTLLSTYKAANSPFAFWSQCAEEYGDPFTITAMNGTVVCTASPEGAREVFTAGADHFEPFGMEAAKPIARHSIFMLGGDEHKRERKLLAPPFHGRRMKLYADTMADAARETIARWEPGQELTMMDELQHISMDVILRACFGAVKGEELDTWRVEVRRFISEFSPSFLFFKILQHEFGGIGPWARFKKAEAHFNAIVYGKIAEKHESGERGDDILSMLMDAEYDDGTRMDDDQVRDELLTLLIAGHETTAVTMTWIFDHLYRHPETLVQLMQELSSVDPGGDPAAYTELPYLTAVCHETLRLHPVLSDLLRQLVKPLTIRGYEVPAGCGVAVLPNVIHARDDIYPEPDQFRPARFVERTYSPYEFLPFGGAPRRCIGSAFAMFEMRIVLGTILSRCRFDLLEAEPPQTERRNLVMGPSHGVGLRFLGAR